MSLHFTDYYLDDGTLCFILLTRGGVAQWVARLTRNVKVVGWSPSKGPGCFLGQETLPMLLSTGWFQERIRSPLVKYCQTKQHLLMYFSQFDNTIIYLYGVNLPYELMKL